MSSKINNNFKSLLKKIESRATYLYKYHYEKYIHIQYNKLIIENLMCNGRCHIVAVFKNYLIEDDNSEYLRRFYKYKESPTRLKKLFLYHDETSVIFPNYTPLEESKYLYNNVIKKQRVIDEQQDLENIRNDLKLKKKNKELKKEEKVFNSTVFGEILTSSESVLRIIFGIDKNDIINNNEKKNEKGENNRNSNDYDYNDIKNLIKELENAEEVSKNINNNSLIGYKLSSNNVLKYKLKLINNFNNNQIKNKNSEKLNNLTNNSTNITNTSNNNNNNTINLNIIKNNQNNSLKDNIFLNNNYNRNSLVITNPNSKNLLKIKYNNNNLIIPNHKKSNSTVPNRTIYGLNFYSNNHNINKILNQPKKSNIKDNSNSHSNNTSRININTYNNNNNYIYNNNFPQNTKKIFEKNNNNINTNKFNISNKSNKALNKIPKIDLHKLDIINNNNNQLLTLTNRNINRNHNHILNNPNLFFAETEALKSERIITRKRISNKNVIKNIMNQVISFSPSNYKSKIIFGRNSNTKLVLIKENLKSVNESKKNKYYNKNKSTKKLIINEYNYKTNFKYK